MEPGAANGDWMARVTQPKLMVAVATLLVLAALGVLRLDPDDGQTEVATVRTTTTTSVLSGTADDVDSVLADDTSTTTSTTPMASSTTTSSTSTTSTSTTSTTLCRNSTNPACGAFRWDPAPFPNQPVVVTVNATADAVAGQPVTFTVHASDTDAQVTFCEVYDLGDGTKQGTIGQRCGAAGDDECGPRHGPWTPPTRKGGTFQYTLTHTYTEPGTYTVRFFSYSEDGGVCHPYGGTKTTELTFVVEAAAGA